MARLQGLTASEARRFRTGRPCLDFAHTGGDGPYAKFELLHSPADLARWLPVVAGLDDVAATGPDLERARALRRAIWAAAHRAMAGAQPGDRDRRAINEAAASSPPVPALLAGGKAGVIAPVTAPQVLSLLARDAIDLFGGPLAGRIRTCSAPDCGLLYVDQSRGGNRQWCSMQRCGTLAKVRAFRARQATG